MIPFNVPPHVGRENEYIVEAINMRKICGDGQYTKKCNEILEKMTGAKRVLLTTSCTHALEMSAILADIKPGDEVIMPSFTFVSTANAFVLRGAKIVFVDVRPDTMNIDEQMIEKAITSRTKAIVPVHYAGVGCEMDTIMDIANSKDVCVIEDAAQAIQSTYKGRALGTFGRYGCFSFHETKNISMGEGGAILFQEENDAEKAEIVREKGTNRSRFFRGQVDKYTWVDMGSSYLPSEINAAYLCAELEERDKILESRMRAWNSYREALIELEEKEYVQLPFIPKECCHNAHMFYIKVKDLDERTNMLEYLKNRGIMAVFHYVPLHTSPAGRKYGEFYGDDIYTTKESNRLIRLPLYYGISKSEIDCVVESIYDFYKN